VVGFFHIPTALVSSDEFFILWTTEITGAYQNAEIMLSWAYLALRQRRQLPFHFLN